MQGRTLINPFGFQASGIEVIGRELVPVQFNKEVQKGGSAEIKQLNARARQEIEGYEIEIKNIHGKGYRLSMPEM